MSSKTLFYGVITNSVEENENDDDIRHSNEQESEQECKIEREQCIQSAGKNEKSI